MAYDNQENENMIAELAAQSVRDEYDHSSQQGQGGEQSQQELDEATIRYETLMHAMSVAQSGTDEDFSAHLAVLENSDDEDEGGQQGRGGMQPSSHVTVPPGEVVAGGNLMHGGLQVVEPVRTNMMLTTPATVLTKPPPSRFSRYVDDAAQSSPPSRFQAAPEEGNQEPTEEFGDIMDVINLNSATPDESAMDMEHFHRQFSSKFDDASPEEEAVNKQVKVEQPLPPSEADDESMMENYRRWIPDTPDMEEGEGGGPTMSQKVGSGEEDANGDKKKMSLRDVRKQAAAVTGFHGFGKKAKAAKEGAASKAKGAVKETMSVFKRNTSKEGKDKARRATLVGGDGVEGHARYQFSEERHVSVERSRSPTSSGMPSLNEEDGETTEEKLFRVSATAHKFAKMGKLEGLSNWLENQSMKPCELDRHDGWTLLHTAAEAGHGPVVAWVVQYHEPLLGEDGASMVSGGNVPATSKTGQGWTAAHVAAAHGHEEVLEVLSELGADLQAVDNSGASPLHSAAGSGCLAAIKTLAAHGCDLDAVTNDGATAAYVAAGNGFDTVVRLLGELGADVNIPTYDGWTPAQIANEMGATKVLHALSDLVVASLSKSQSGDNYDTAASSASLNQNRLSPPLPPTNRIVREEAVAPVPQLPRVKPQLPAVPDGFVYREVTFTEADRSMNIMIAAGVGNFPIVTQVNDNSPCKAAGVMPQDLIVGVTPSLNFIPPNDPEDMVSRLYPGELLLLRTHDEALAILPRSGRPVKITFMSRIEEDQDYEEEVFPSGPWACSVCTFENQQGSNSCAMCGQARGGGGDSDGVPPPPPMSSLPVGVSASSPMITPASAEWECGVCTFHNPKSSAGCEMCGTPNPTFVTQVALEPEPVRPVISQRTTSSSNSASASASAWREVESDEYPGQYYFLNDVTGVAQWERPAELEDIPPPPPSTASPVIPRAIDNTEEYYGVNYPVDVASWIHDCCNLSAVQEMKLLEGMCGPDSEFGVMELDELKDIEGPYLAKLLELVPIAKRKKFERELRSLRGEN